MEASSEPLDVSSAVLALVLTYNSPANAALCVSALDAQSRRPNSILVVDNAGKTRVDPEKIALQTSIPVDVMLLAENVGPAGGFAAGLEEAMTRECSAIWVMDDDVAPETDCLTHLIRTLQAHDGRAVVAPETFDAVSGQSSSGWGWCGVLLPKQLVENIGLPRTELFYGFEDQDYLIDRSQAAGFTLARAAGARAMLARRAPGTGWPEWQYYYMPRNATYQYVYRRVHIPLGKRLKRLAHFYVSWWNMNGKVRAGRLRKSVLFARGIVDGLLGRLGRRVVPSDDRRPTLAAATRSATAWRSPRTQ